MQIALIGYGKMGKAIEEVALSRGHSVVLRIDAYNLEDFTAKKLRDADVAIEFTHPDSAFENIRKCIEAGVPVVSGTTGWLERIDEIKKICKELDGTFVYASNYSIGVNIFFEVNKRLAQLMSGHPEYDVQMEEIHHTQKKDAPSGTAITLAEQILERVPRKKQWINEPGQDPSKLNIISKRIDPAPGTHIIRYTSPIDDIEITHTAHNRVGFASGAVLAAEYAAGKKGIFTMKDVLGL